MDAVLEGTIANHLAAADYTAAARAAIQGLGPPMLAYLGAHLRDENAASIVFDHFCKQLWRSIATFRSDISIETWAYKLAMHSVRYYREAGFRPSSPNLHASEASALAEQVRSRLGPPRRPSKDRNAMLRDMLDPDEQSLLFFRVDRGLSWADIATILGDEDGPVDVSLLRKRYERAKSRLGELAQKYGIADS